MHTKRLAVAALAPLSLAISAGAQEILIDHEDFPHYFETHTDKGVTFTPPEGEGVGLLTIAFTPNLTMGLIEPSADFELPIIANVINGATSVSVDIGDAGADADPIYLIAYDEDGFQVDAAYETLPSSFIGMHTLTVTGEDIRWLEYGATSSGIFTDNFRYVPVCPADLTFDGDVDVADLLEVILNWGNAGPSGDATLDGTVDVADLTTVIQAWGSCPN